MNWHSFTILRPLELLDSSCFTYSSSLKMEAACSPKCRLTYNGLQVVMTVRVRLFITSYSTNVVCCCLCLSQSNSFLYYPPPLVILCILVRIRIHCLPISRLVYKSSIGLVQNYSFARFGRVWEGERLWMSEMRIVGSKEEKVTRAYRNLGYLDVCWLLILNGF
jgi:hypothetical protein